MGYVTKNNPIGVDIVINDLVESIYDDLTSFGWTNYEAYHRVYKNPVSATGEFIPEAYTGESINQHDYKEVLMDDTYRSTSFVLTGDNTTFENGLYSIPLSIIFQVNCQELYDQLTHRADEEARNDAIVAVQRALPSSRLESIVTSIPVVYSEFKTDNITFTDMTPYHVFRVNTSVLVDYSCDYFCTYLSDEDTGFNYRFDSGLN